MGPAKADADASASATVAYWRLPCSTAGTYRVENPVRLLVLLS